jgi:hypothetical protein
MSARLCGAGPAAARWKSALPFLRFSGGAGPSLPAVLRDNAIGTGFSLNSNF